MVNSEGHQDKLITHGDGKDVAAPKHAGLRWRKLDDKLSAVTIARDDGQLEDRSRWDLQARIEGIERMTAAVVMKQRDKRDVPPSRLQRRYHRGVGEVQGQRAWCVSSAKIRNFQTFHIPSTVPVTWLQFLM